MTATEFPVEEMDVRFLVARVSRKPKLPSFLDRVPMGQTLTTGELEVAKLEVFENRYENMPWVSL